MKSYDEFPSTLLDFIHSFGAMNCLISDNAKAELPYAVKNILRQFQITAQQSEQFTKPKTQLNAAFNLLNLLSGI
jgi:hypothetical protein